MKECDQFRVQTFRLIPIGLSISCYNTLNNPIILYIGDLVNAYFSSVEFPPAFLEVVPEPVG